MKSKTAHALMGCGHPPPNDASPERAEFLIEWFLENFEGRRAPFPRKCFASVAHWMRVWLEKRQEERKPHG